MEGLLLWCFLVVVMYLLFRGAKSKLCTRNQVIYLAIMSCFFPYCFSRIFLVLKYWFFLSYILKKLVQYYQGFFKINLAQNGKSYIVYLSTILLVYKKFIHIKILLCLLTLLSILFPKLCAFLLHKEILFLNGPFQGLHNLSHAKK